MLGMCLKILINRKASNPSLCHFLRVACPLVLRHGLFNGSLYSNNHFCVFFFFASSSFPASASFLWLAQRYSIRFIWALLLIIFPSFFSLNLFSFVFIFFVHSFFLTHTHSRSHRSHSRSAQPKEENGKRKTRPDLHVFHRKYVHSGAIKRKLEMKIQLGGFPYFVENFLWNYSVIFGMTMNNRYLSHVQLFGT